jgi:predicted RNase H-like nuclease (RuvC/YqgF family)
MQTLHPYEERLIALRNEGISFNDMEKIFIQENLPRIDKRSGQLKQLAWHKRALLAIAEDLRKRGLLSDKTTPGKKKNQNKPKLTTEDKPQDNPEIDELKKQIDTLKSANKGYLAKIDELQKENDKLRKRALDAENNLRNNQNEEITQLKTQNETLKKENNEFQCRNAELRIESQSLQRKVSRLENQINQIDKPNDKPEKDMDMIQSLIARIETLESKMASVEKQVNKPINPEIIPKDRPEKINIRGWNIQARPGKKGGITYRGYKNFGKDIGIKACYIGKSLDNAEAILMKKEAEILPQGIDRDLIMKTYQRIAERIGFSNIMILDLQAETGIELKQLQNFLRAESRAGRAVLTPSDFSIATEEQKNAAIVLNGRHYFQVRFD